MASLFECEVRFTIEDIKSFEDRLKELEAKLVYPYEFTDYYFRPVKEKWNLVEKNLRIREWKSPQKPTTIFFVKNEVISLGDIKFKRALYPDGKVALFSGELNICRSLLRDLGFEPWFSVRKENASMWDIPKYGFKTVAEHIEGLGWSGELEFEGEDPKKAKEEIEKALNALKIPKDLVSFKPISAIFAEKRNIV
ncbi:hypothetical protein CMO89_00870 [Candidatus Woesearchaeota archaeon]|nr:hypothetical protein [Candidatus Woesearchaeota archaeon]|tara:strand:+ start:12136 stop:12720 length:585 start_codon:yes stop_codon:yes gene_type:complete